MNKFVIKILNSLGLGINAAYTNPTVLAYNAHTTIGCQVDVIDETENTFTLRFHPSVDETINVKYMTNDTRIINIEII